MHNKCLGHDRIIAIYFDFNMPYLEEDFNAEAFYKDVVGITVNQGLRTQKIQLWIDRENAPYVLTKPLHTSQVLEKENVDGSIEVSLYLKINYELERLLLGFGNSLHVIAPVALRNQMRKKLEAAFEHYQNLDPTPVISL